MPKVGHLIAKILSKIGVKYVFGVPGAHTEALYDGICEKEPNIQHILMHDEANSGFAADGYSRISNKIGVVDATAGPGITRLITALAESYGSSIPVIAIVGDTPVNYVSLKIDRALVSQGIDQISLLRPVSKYVIYVTRPLDVAPSLLTAIRIATSYRFGPVVVDIPMNVMNSEIDVASQLAKYSEVLKRYNVNYPRNRIIDESKLNIVLEYILNSNSPIVIVGNGIHLSQAWNEVREFCEYLSLPVVSTIMGKSILPETHPLFYGIIGYLGYWSLANDLLKKADLIIVLGSQLGQFSTCNWNLIPSDATIIHIDIDPLEQGRGIITKNYIEITGDLKLVLQKLINIIKGYANKDKLKLYKDNMTSRIEELRKLKEKIIKSYMEISFSTTLRPSDVLKILNKIIKERRDIIIVSDASSSSGLTARYLMLEKSTKYRRYLAPRGFAGLGYGLPAGIGAKLALQQIGANDKVLIVTGDGAFGYVVNELETVKRLKLPLTIIVLNDSAFGWIKIEQLKYYKRVYSSEFTYIDFAKIAKAYGIEGYSVEKAKELDEVLRNAVKDDQRAILINVKVKSEVPLIGLETEV